MQYLPLMVLALACVAKPESLSAVAEVDTRITGGSLASITDYPYQLSLQYDDVHFCGASIISGEWALTAAHCCYGALASLTLRAGSSVRGTGGTVHHIAEKIVHELWYTSFIIEYDVALLRVEQAFNFGPGIRPIRLPAPDLVISAGSLSTITGWGVTETDGKPATILHVATVPVTRAATCKAAYGASQITDNLICAGYPRGGVDFCQNDEGGPMVVNMRLVGVMSYGMGCGLPGYPSVYTRVASMRDWIRSISGV